MTTRPTFSCFQKSFLSKWILRKVLVHKSSHKKAAKVPPWTCLHRFCVKSFHMRFKWNSKLIFRIDGKIKVKSIENRGLCLNFANCFLTYYSELISREKTLTSKCKQYKCTLRIQFRQIPLQKKVRACSIVMKKQFTLIEKIFRQINSTIAYLVKTLFWRSFCLNNVRVNFCDFQTVSLAMHSKYSTKALRTFKPTTRIPTIQYYFCK